MNIYFLIIITVLLLTFLILRKTFVKKIEPFNDKQKLSFIILRHVGNKNQNIYWNVCYDNIREIYKTEPIYIIDDNSKYNPTRIGKKMKNTTIIKSEFPHNRGELLPYYYFHKYKFSKNTIILHDTAYIHKKIDPKLLYTKTYHFLWDAYHDWDVNYDEPILDILKKMDNEKNNITLYNNKDKWNVCFGGMAILNINYLNSIFDNNNYFNVLLKEINSRSRRMCFERIIAILLTKDKKTKSMNGIIHTDQKWGTKITEYNKLKNINTNKKMSKIWLGREG